MQELNTTVNRSVEASADCALIDSGFIPAYASS